MPHFTNIDVIKDQIVIKEGDIADKVFVIKDGEFGVTRNLIQK